MIRPLGDDGLLYIVPEAKRDEAVPMIQTMTAKLSQIAEFENIVPAYNSLLIQFRPQDMSMEQARAHLEKALNTANTEQEKIAHSLEIPVCYGGIYGPDLDDICRAKQLTMKELIQIHSQPNYTVCQLGFLPGFAYLSAVDERLHIARHKTPRLHVAAGSVGIAGWQTGLYGIDSPGGWQIIGRTPLNLFNPHAAKPSPLINVTQIKFKPISAKTFNQITENNYEH